jgi:hypothetical protein
LKVKGKSKKEMAKAIFNLGCTLITAESIRDYVLDIIGVSDIKKHCVEVVY